MLWKFYALYVETPNHATKSLFELDQDSIGPLLRESRLSAGYSLRELAKRTGASR